MLYSQIDKDWLVSIGYVPAIPGSQTLVKKAGRMEIYLHSVEEDDEEFWKVEVRYIYRVRGNEVNYVPLTKELAKYKLTLVRLEQEFGV